MTTFQLAYYQRTSQRQQTRFTEIQQRITAQLARNTLLSQKLIRLIAQNHEVLHPCNDRYHGVSSTVVPVTRASFKSAPVPSVWLVDDDEDDQYLLGKAFRSLLPQLDIKALDDGVQLLDALSQTATLPGLVLLDLNMPRKNGFEVLLELRSIPSYDYLPLVVLTTSTEQYDRTKSLEMGANGFLTKVPGQVELKQMIAQLALDWHLF